MMGFGKWALAGLGLAVAGGAVAYAQYRNIEQPAYRVVLADGPFELRDYEPLVVAEVTHTGDRERASGASFRRLAAYIFGQDRPAGGEDIAMTAPVLQQRVPADEPIAMTSPVLQQETETGQWRMRFVMPAQYTLATLPPAPADITLQEVPGRRIAAVAFSGSARPDQLSRMESELTDWLAKRGLEASGPIEYAFYDAPMVPPPLRRNEVLVEVRAD